MNIMDFAKSKKEGKKITMVTSYDYWTAKIINETAIDVILVGDSAAMVMHGFPSTLQATVEMMEWHVAAVRRGAPSKFIVADMPFMSFRKGIAHAAEAVERLMRAGAQAVKVEGVRGHEDVIRHLVDSGVPVMGHLGLIPQSINKFGGFKVQGKDQKAAQNILLEADILEELGAFSVVLECIPSMLAAKVTSSLQIPTIGIGAGADVDGQVLVLQDLLGANTEFKPKFLRQYMDGVKLIKESLDAFSTDVKGKSFPSEKETYA